MRHLGLKEKAYKYVKSRLLSGDIKPGERIREDLIAEEISMSRTPVREAINQLSAEGFVNQIPRKGLFATEFTKGELLDIIELRGLLETYAIRRCCQRVTDGELDDLETILKKYKSALIDDDAVTAGLYDGLFHKKIASISRNMKAITFIDEIEDLTTFARRMDIFNRFKYSEQKFINQHEYIFMAIKNRDEEAAVKAIETNINEALSRFIY